VLLGHPAITSDSLAAIAQQLARGKTQMLASVEQRAKRPQNLPFPLDAYTGHYANPAMGHLEVRLVNGRLEARMGAAVSAVDVYDNTKNQLRFELFGNGTVVTVEMKNGRAETMTFDNQTYVRDTGP
jgi:hypothetical protein